MKPNKHWIKYLPLALMLACAALFLLAGAGLGTEDLLRWSPADPWLAALFLVGLYGVKSMTVFFPLAALYLVYLFYQIAKPYLTRDPYGPTSFQFTLGAVVLGGGAAVLGLLAWKMFKAPLPEDPEEPALPEEAEEEED